MSFKPPLLSGREIVKVCGSHIKIRNPAAQITLIIPDHQEVDRWTLKGILKDAEISVEEFSKLL